MRIAMMTNNYKPFVAGVPISIERLANGLRKEGHEVVIFAPTYKEQLIQYAKESGLSENVIFTGKIDNVRLKDYYGVSDLVIDGKNGFLVPEDTDVFADRMQILITDSLLAERLKEGARATSLLFDESNIAKEAIKQYNRVVDAAKAGQFRMTGLQKQYIFLSNNRRGADKWKTKIVS